MSMNQLTNQQQARPPTQPSPGPQQSPSQMQPPGSMGSRTGGFDPAASPVHQHGPGQQLGGPPPLSGQPHQGSGYGHERSFSHGALLNQVGQQSQQPYNVRNSTQAAPSQSRFELGGSGNPSGPPQLGALPFQTRPESPPQKELMAPYPGPQQPDTSGRSVSPPSTVTGPAKSKQVFGIPLMRLYERDSLAVPMVVYQCIQAVDLYGLAVEGIYRLSGSQTHVNKLKSLFDTGSSSPTSAYPFSATRRVPFS